MPLTQKQIEQIPIHFLKKIEALEVDTMAKVSERIGRIGKLTATDLHKLNQLANIGFEVEDFEKQLNTIILESDTEIYESLKKSIDYVPSKELDDLIESVAKITKDQFVNISETAGFVNAKGDLAKYSDFYRDIIDKATLEIRTGVTDFNSAMRSSLRSMADRGLSHVAYESGYIRRADTSVRSALIGANSRLSMQAAEINAERIGATGFEITWHSGFRPSHDFGGKQFTMKEYHADIEPLLHDFNCYHRAMPIRLGLSEPVYTAAELKKMNADEEKTVMFEGVKYNKYDAQQMQRKLETAIRTQKDRTIVFAHDKDELLKAKARLAAVSDKYVKFSIALDVPQKPQRISVAGYRKRK